MDTTRDKQVYGKNGERECCPDRLAVHDLHASYSILFVNPGSPARGIAEYKGSTMGIGSAMGIGCCSTSSCWRAGTACTTYGCLLPRSHHKPAIRQQQQQQQANRRASKGRRVQRLLSPPPKLLSPLIPNSPPSSSSSSPTKPPPGRQPGEHPTPFRVHALLHPEIPCCCL